MKEENTIYKEIDFAEISVRINKTIKDVLEIYSKLHVPRQALLEDYLAVITTKYINEVHNPWLYYHKGVRKQNVEQVVSLLETAFIEGAMKLSKQKPTDVIRAAFYTTRNDSALESGFLLNEYVGTLTQEDDALIINPSPDMILQFENERVGKGVNYYVVMDGTVAKLYSEQFSKSVFLSLDDEIGKVFKSVLAVNRDCEIDETFRLMRWLSCCEERMLAELPNAYLDNSKYGAEALIST